MPCLGRIPFLQEILKALNNGVRVSMPCLGRIPFLRREGKARRAALCLCQCPVSGESHFYQMHRSAESWAEKCQCPVSGESHFYQRKEGRSNCLKMCQCPVSGESHFYRQVMRKNKTAMEKCQCPVSGESHFYGEDSKPPSLKVIKVSMPCLGRIPFLLTLTSMKTRAKRKCVNALSRANPISTGRLQVS